MKWVNSIFYPQPKSDKTTFIINLKDSDCYRIALWNDSDKVFYDKLDNKFPIYAISKWAYLHDDVEFNESLAVLSSLDSIINISETDVNKSNRYLRSFYDTALSDIFNARKDLISSIVNLL